jgi:hypothetical protein
VAARRDITAKMRGRRTTWTRRECWKKKKKKEKKKRQRQLPKDKEKDREKTARDGNGKYFEFFERPRSFVFAHGGHFAHAEGINAPQVRQDRKASL